MSAEFPTAVIGAIGRVLKVAGLSLSGGSDGNGASQVLAVVIFLAGFTGLVCPSFVLGQKSGPAGVQGAPWSCFRLCQ